MALCPTCHSNIGTDSETDTGRQQSKEGTDANDNPVPRWSDDPVFTPGGLSSAPYAQQMTRVRKKHIIELQEARVAEEADAGLTPTDFSDVEFDVHVSRRHIVELRESTERLLNNAGATLEEYFKTDSEGIVQSQNPNVVRAGGNDPQDEWVDVQRGASYISKTGSAKSEFELPDNTTEQSPTLPSRTHIRAIHIEDLRHPAIVSTLALLILPQSGRIFKAKLSGATFKQTEEC